MHLKLIEPVIAFYPISNNFFQITSFINISLPKDRPGTIFIKIPQEWQTSLTIWAEIKSICEEFLNQHLRLVSIIIFASHILPEDDILRFWFTGVEISSHVQRFNTFVNRKLFDGKAPQCSTPKYWITLEDILKYKPAD